MVVVLRPPPAHSPLQYSLRFATTQVKYFQKKQGQRLGGGWSPKIYIKQKWKDEGTTGAQKVKYGNLVIYEVHRPHSVWSNAAAASAPKTLGYLAFFTLGPKK